MSLVRVDQDQVVRMSETKIAVVEDNKVERQTLLDQLAALQKQDGLSLEIRAFPSGSEFLAQYKADYALVFLDIDMPGLNGIETARAIRRADSTAILIFVTNMAQYALTGYEVEAFDFILKPINPYNFAIKVRRALNRVAKDQGNAIMVREKGGARRVQISDIRYLEVTGHYVIYPTTAGDLTEYSTLKDASQKINSPLFVQCNQSYLIHLKYVDAVSRESVQVAGQELFISRKMRSSFLAAVAGYFGGSLK